MIALHTAHSGSHMTIELTRYAEDIGADGAMLLPPYYGTNGGGFFSLTDDERRRSSMMLADRVVQRNAGGFKDSSGDFAFYRAHSQLLEGKVATMGSAGMNYYLWGHEFGSSCFLTGLGNIWPRWEIEFYDHLAAGWYCTY